MDFYFIDMDQWSLPMYPHINTPSFSKMKNRFNVVTYSKKENALC